MSQFPCLYCTRLAAHEWIGELRHLAEQAGLGYIYAESVSDIHLAAYRAPQPDWDHGRVFGAPAELRWNRRRDGRVDLVLLTEGQVPAPQGWRPLHLLESDPTGTEVRVEDGSIALRGVSRRHSRSPYGGGPEQPAEWTDTQIPRGLTYPLSQDEQEPLRWVRLRVKKYLADECLLLTRMAGLEASDDVKPL